MRKLWDHSFGNNHGDSAKKKKKTGHFEGSGNTRCKNAPCKANNDFFKPFQGHPGGRSGNAYKRAAVALADYRDNVIRRRDARYAKDRERRCGIWLVLIAICRCERSGGDAIFACLARFTAVCTDVLREKKETFVTGRGRRPVSRCLRKWEWLCWNSQLFPCPGHSLACHSLNDFSWNTENRLVRLQRSQCCRKQRILFQSAKTRKFMDYNWTGNSFD